MYNVIKVHIKEAMKEKNLLKKDVLKMVLDKARAIMKQKNPTGADEVIPDDIILQAVQQEYNQLNKAIEEMNKEDKKHGNTNCQNSDYYSATKHKAAILSEYLPKQMTREEVVAAVHEILDGEEFIGFGLMMKKVMSELKGKADARLIREVVESL